MLEEVTEMNVQLLQTAVAVARAEQLVILSRMRSGSRS